MDMTFLNVSRFASENIKFSSSKMNADFSFSKAQSIDAFSYVYLTCSLYDAYKKGIKGINFPQGTGYFHFNNFIWRYFPEGVDSIAFDRTIKISYRGFDVDDIEEKLVQLLIENNVDVDIPSFREYVSEITDNVKSHAIYPYMFIRCNYHSTEKYFDVAIGDVGLGIKDSLLKNPTYSHLASLSHQEAILKAFEERVTSKADARGLGLTMTSDYFMEEPRGTLFLCSGDGYYMATYNPEGDSKTSGNLKYNIDGVQALLRFRCGK